MTILVVALALLVALQYCFIALYVVPRLAQLADHQGGIIRAGQLGAAVFLLGCATTHVGIAVHTLQAGFDAGHLLLVHVWPHVAQIAGGATFSYIAWSKLEVRFASKGYEEARERAERERLQAAAQVALEARREAERANRAKSEFLSRMSHELRTPLNAVLGFAQLLEMDDLDERQADGVRQIKKGGHHLLDLIDEVLDIARIESGRTTLAMEPVNAAAVLDDVLAFVEPMADERNIRLNADARALAGKAVTADVQRLKQVLLNLLSNAIKYNREGGEVTVSAEASDGDRVRILVSDTGRGIPADKLDRLFTPFDRLGAERTGVTGTGLGLAVSKALTDAMGGSLTVESEPGRGTTFGLELAPAAPSPAREPAAAAAPTLPASADPGEAGPGVASLGLA